MIHVELFGTSNQVDKLKQSLYVGTHASKDKWMTIPDVGHVIASKYIVVLVSLFLEQSITFFILEVNYHYLSQVTDLLLLGLYIIVTLYMYDMLHFI